MANKNIENKVEGAAAVKKAEVKEYLNSMVDLTPYDLKHSQDGKDAYNCDPCDGCGPDASFSDSAQYESLRRKE